MLSQSVRNMGARKASLKKIDLDASIASTAKANKMVSFTSNTEAISVTSG